MPRKDPDTFDPDHFLEENVRGRAPWIYLPFSGGQRVCIGNNFSLVESVLVIAQILQRIEFAMVPGQIIEPVVVTTTRPSKPVTLQVRKRSRPH